jgi:small conductance mechanosensitive channel
MEQKTYIQTAIDFAWNYGPNLVIAVLLLFGGLWVIKRVSAGFDHFLRAQKIDDSLRPFFSSLVDVAMKVVLLLVVAGRMGIETTSFIAVFSAIAFAVGLALQGSLGNFASGVLILLFRPYKVGDYITVEDKTGKVSEIQIFNTILQTPQCKKIIIPNGKITEGAIENITAEGEVRNDIILHVLDTTSINLMRAVAEDVVQRCPFAVPGKPAFVQISGFPKDAMRVEVGCWTTGQHYLDTFYYLHEELKKAFDAVGIEMAKDDDDKDNL